MTKKIFKKTIDKLTLLWYNDYRKREKEVIKMFVKVNQVQYGYDVAVRFNGEHEKAKKVYKVKQECCPSGMRKFFLV